MYVYELFVDICAILACTTTGISHANAAVAIGRYCQLWSTNGTDISTTCTLAFVEQI
jgi:hypothetical protein